MVTKAQSGNANAYQGTLGKTGTERVRYSCPCGGTHSVDVYRSIDVHANPELAERILSTDAESYLNAFRCGRSGEHHMIHVPVAYHAPETEVFVLVVPESRRHREIESRIDLLSQMSDDDEAPMPRYVRDFRVVFGPAELKAFLEDQAETALAQVRGAEARQELERRGIEIEEQQRGIAAQKAEIDRLAAEFDRSNDSINERMEAIEAREAALDRRSSELEQKSRDLSVRKASSPGEVKAERTTNRDLGAAVLPLQRAISDDGQTKVGKVVDVAIERWIVSGEPTLIQKRDDGSVSVAASLEIEELEALVTDRLEMRIQLHRMPTFPIITLVVGTPESLRGEGTRPTMFLLNIGTKSHQEILGSLAKDFSFTLEVFDREYLPVRKATLSANLADNVPYLLAAAEAHAKSLNKHDRSFTKAEIALNNPAYDQHGLHHPERKEFSEEALTALSTPNEVRWALAVAERFSAPEREEYLLMIRGYPLALWHARRREIVGRAVELGLWMGTDLAQVAVSEDIARSRKDLIRKLQVSFTALVHDPDDLDDGAIQDNWAALEEEGERLGLVIKRQRKATDSPVSSGDAPDQLVSGTIGSTNVRRVAEAAAKHQVSERSMDELISYLEDKDQRMHAAIELAHRGEERAIGPVFNTLRRMTRGEAVQVLGASVGFGGRAVAHLLDGLRSRKAFLRQGCALALSILGEEEGVEAICDLLVSEPTPIWKEVARAIGEVGPSAVMSLATRVRGNAEASERVAWGLAHVVNNGGEPQVSTLASSRDQRVSATAQRALEIAPDAKLDNAVIHGEHPPREQTVNRAFSRRFFAALDSSGPQSNNVHHHENSDVSAPAMLLDEADLLEAADLEEVEQLDESDLIST